MHYGVPTTVIYASDFSVAGYYDRDFDTKFAWDTDLLSGYNAVFLSRVEDGGSQNDEGVSAKGIHKLIRQLNPKVILLTGYRLRFDMRAFGAAWRTGCPLLFRAETLDNVQTQKNTFKRVPRDIFLRWLYSQIDQLLYIGQNSKKHYLRLGVPNTKLTFSPYCVDISPFEVGEDARERLRASTRERLQIDDDSFVVLVSGKLIPRKSPAFIMQALKRVPDKLRSKTVVIFLGDGELRDTLVQLASTPPIINARFVGFQNQTQLSGYYHAADIMVLASQLEPWGLVVNEALHHGLPCLVSDRVGCAPDLVQRGVTGYVFTYGDIDELTQSFVKSATQFQRLETRLACRNLASRYGIRQAAAGIAAAYYTLNKAIGN